MRVRNAPGAPAFESRMTLYLARSRSRTKFKRLLGNANHLIITALVGLDAVERGVIREVPEGLHAAWSPKDASKSAERSRRLILDMALIRAIDALDIYLRHIQRKPSLVHSEELRQDLDSAGLSIFQKLRAIERNCPTLDSLPLALIFLMVAWRNRSAHSEADRDAPQNHLNELHSRVSEIATRFRGIDINFLLDGYESERPITFKEVASLINAVHHLVSELDCHLLVSLDVDRFLRDLVWVSLSDSQREGEEIDKARMRRAISIWGKDRADRAAAVERLLNQSGFSTAAPNDFSGARFPSELIQELQNQTPKSVLKWADVR